MVTSTLPRERVTKFEGRDGRARAQGCGAADRTTTHRSFAWLWRRSKATGATEQELKSAKCRPVFRME